MFFLSKFCQNILYPLFLKLLSFCLKAGDPLARGEGQADGTSRVYIAVIFIQGGGNGKVR